MFLAFGSLALDGAGFAMRWWSLKWEGELGDPAHPSIFRARRRLMFLRLLDVNLLPAGLLMIETPLGAACVLALGILVDRYAFYALALRQNPEAEITRVENILRDKHGVSPDSPDAGS